MDDNSFGMVARGGSHGEDRSRFNIVQLFFLGKLDLVFSKSVEIKLTKKNETLTMSKTNEQRICIRSTITTLCSAIKNNFKMHLK